MKPILVFHSNSELLEGPVFDPTHHLLYFVSIIEVLVYCLNPSSKEISSIQLDSPVGCVFITGKKRVVAASKNGFFSIDFNTLQKQFVYQIDIGNSVRFNDGIQDSKGRFLVGTMGYPQVVEKLGTVFSYFNGQHKSIIERTTISNGLAFSKDESILYFIDTPTQKVAKYNYDLTSGETVFDSYVIELKEIGSPDGMCMDEEGMLWIAEWGGGKVSRWNPVAGKKIEEKTLPCTNVTSCCLDDKGNLFITTAKSETEEGIYGGALYYLELNKV